MRHLLLIPAAADPLDAPAHAARRWREIRLVVRGSDGCVICLRREGS